ncbi:hypothetical protein N7507_009319 [Penicillium longicatenatum]|nr:hypothetical protein N7507_009319 [Penicillium longicatenatum]
MDCFKAVDANSNEITGYFVLARKQSVEEDLIDNGNEVSGKLPQMASIVVSMESFANIQAEVIYMCVKPSHQRKGIGSKLVQLGFDRAHAEDIPLTICAEAPADEFFNKLGFEDMTHCDIDLRKYAPANSGFGIFRLTGEVWRP